MASFLLKNNPWIESTILYAASFEPASLQGDDDDSANDNDKREGDEEPQTENTIPSGLLPSPPKHGHGSNAPPSRRGKIVQVIQRGGDFDWQSHRPRLGSDNDDASDYCPPYLVIHDGQYSTIAFLSPETLTALSSSSTILANRALISISNYTVSTILQCCQKKTHHQHRELHEGQQQKHHQGQGNSAQMTKMNFDFEMHSQILSHLYFTTSGNKSTTNSTSNHNNNNNNHNHHHEPNGYTLIPPEIQSQLPHQITNNQLYLCLYVQGHLSMIGAENQGLIGHPKDVHCSPKLRRELMKHEEILCDEDEKWKEVSKGEAEGDSYSHFVLIQKLEAVHRHYYLLDQKKNGTNDVATVVAVAAAAADEDKEEEEEEEEVRPPRGHGGGAVGRTKTQHHGRRPGQKKDHGRRVATRSQTKHFTKSIMTNAIPVWPWKSRSSVDSRSVCFASTRDAAPRGADKDRDHDDENEIVSAMLVLKNSVPREDDISITLANGGGGRPGMNVVVSQTRAAAPAASRGGDIPNTEATTPTDSASTPRPPMGNVQELFDLGVDIEEFLGLESQSDSDDNAVSAAAATRTATTSVAPNVGDSNDDRNLSIEGREVDGGRTEREDEAPIDYRHVPLDQQRQQHQRRRRQSPNRESAHGSTQETRHEVSFVGINDMLVDEDDDAHEDNGGDEQRDENRDEMFFEDGGGNYDDLDETEQLFQTQPESTAYNSETRNNRIEDGAIVEALEYQAPQPTTRKVVNQQQLEDEQQRGSRSRNPSRKKKSRRRRQREEEDEDDDYPIPISQRKPPPETLEGYIAMESRIPLPFSREASHETVRRADGKEYEKEDENPIPLLERNAPLEVCEGQMVLESQIPLPPRMAPKQSVEHSGEEEGDKEEESEDENQVVGRRSQVPISTKSRTVQFPRKKTNNSTASIMKQKKVSRKDNHLSEDEDFSDDDWMRVRKSTKQCDLGDSDDEDSNDWMKVRQTAKQTKRHRTADDDNNDDDIDFDDVADEDDVDDDSSDETYEPRSQIAGEGSEETVPQTSLKIKSVSNRDAIGERAEGNHKYQRNHVRFVKIPPKEDKYDVTAFSSKASAMLGFTSSKMNVQKKVGQKKTRGEHFDVASFIDKAQRLCGL